MPFNISPSSYQGGSYLFAGISGLGKGIADALEKSQEQSKMESYNDSIVQHAYQTGQLDLEQLTKYRQMSHTQKTGFAASLAANFAEDMKRQQLAAMEEQRQAQAELRRQQAAAFDFVPRAVTLDQQGYPYGQAVDPAAALPRQGIQMIETRKGQWEMPSAAAGAAWNPSGKAMWVTDPSGKVIGRQVQTGPNQSQFLPGTGDIEVKIDQVTKTPMYKKGKDWVPFKGQDLMAGQMMPQEPTPTPTPAPGGSAMSNIISQIQNALVSTGLGARPAAATPTPETGEAATTGNEVKGKKLDQATALEFLRQAGGDKDKARALALAAGYTF